MTQSKKRNDYRVTHDAPKGREQKIPKPGFAHQSNVPFFLRDVYFAMRWSIVTNYQRRG